MIIRKKDVQAFWKRRLTYEKPEWALFFVKMSLWGAHKIRITKKTRTSNKEWIPWEPKIPYHLILYCLNWTFVGPEKTMAKIKIIKRSQKAPFQRDPSSLFELYLLGQVRKNRIHLDSFCLNRKARQKHTPEKKSTRNCFYDKIYAEKSLFYQIDLPKLSFWFENFF